MKPIIQRRLRSGTLSVVSIFVLSWQVAGAVELPTTELLPVVPGDEATRSTPFIAWFKDLSAQGYVEEEYAVSGAADLYDYVDDAGQSPEINVVTPDVAYVTRMLVRRPSDPADFNGTVFVEVLNATAGWDGDPIWQRTHEAVQCHRLERRVVGRFQRGIGRQQVVAPADLDAVALLSDTRARLERSSLAGGRTAEGRIVHTGDFNRDTSPGVGEPFDEAL